MTGAIVPYERRASGNPEYEEIIAEVFDRYDQVLELLGRSHSALYSFLGCIHEATARIDASPTLRSLLVAEVGRIVDEGRKGRRRWDVSDRKTADLLLMLKTSASPEFTSLKCRWLRALRAAALPKSGPVSPTEGAFVGWIQDKGVGGAGELARESQEFNLIEFDAGFEDAASVEITLPGDVDLSGGWAVALLKIIDHDRYRANVIPVEIFTDDQRIKNLCSAAVRRWDKQMRDHHAEIEMEQRAMAKAYDETDAGDPGARGSIRPEDVDPNYATMWWRDKDSGLASDIRGRR